jgi:hypothetical protein
MSKLSIQYTDDNGRVFSIDAEGATFKAGRSDLNDGRLINIPDMKDSESWQHTREEAIVLSAANATDSINNKPKQGDEDFI